MKNFEFIATSLDVEPLLAAINRVPHRWAEITLRQTFPGTAHHDTETIFVRCPKPGPDLQNEVESIDFPGQDIWITTGATALIDKAMAAVMQQDHGSEFELGRVMVVRLKPGGAIDRHSDEGAYAEHFSRFHISLQSDAGNRFRCGDEIVHMLPGDCWWFDHRTEHEVRNDTDRDRIHLIFDARFSGLYRKEA